MTCKVDVTISGGGLAGLLTARVTSLLGLNSIVFEAGSVADTAKRDGRLLAISYTNQQALKRWGVWNDDIAEPILSIKIVDGYSDNVINLEHNLLGQQPFGYMVPASWMYGAIKDINLLENTSAQVVREDECCVFVDADRSYSSYLHVLAEGKRANIPTISSDFDYHQTMITFTINHEFHHKNMVVERFFERGPFGVLPRKGGFSSSIVWAEPKHMADSLFNSEYFLHELRQRVSYLGNVEVVSEIYSYDLGLHYAHNYSKGRVLVMGDSAHAIHPLTGQGFNLTIGDLIVLEEKLKEAIQCGLDISFILSSYEKRRKPINCSMIAVTDGLNELFSNDSTVLKVIRRLGMGAVNRSDFMKKLCLSAVPS